VSLWKLRKQLKGKNIMGAAKNLDYTDDDALCPCDTVDTFKIMFIGGSNSAIAKETETTHCVTIGYFDHGDPKVAELLPKTDVALIVLRIAEFFEDLEEAKRIMQKRPLLPVIGLCKNDDQEIKIMALNAGIAEILPPSISPEELSARMSALGRLGRACRLMELQNDELIRSMNKVNALETERQKNQATLVQNSKMASLGEMAGNLAHEINNPLGILNGRIMQMRKILGANPIPLNEAGEILDRMTAVSKRIAAITKGLKSFSRMGEKDPLEPTSIASIVDDTLSFCAEGIRQLGIDLTVASIDPNLIINCRPTQISQVVLNLLSNARDAIENFSEKWIKVSCEIHTNAAGAKVAWIKIMDSGKGLPPELVQKIYEPFFTTKPVNKGTGLGLSISKTILHEHEGELTLDQTCSNTCFVVKIPLKV
jgi:C4-dicarboxylate-specific signal transduction histidine kinase